MLEAHIQGVGLISPRLTDWQQARTILCADSALPDEVTLPQLNPTLLPANERRRTTLVTKLALQASQDLFSQCAMPEGLHSVFASAEGDLETFDRICRALLLPERPVSPTHFHNSVHNAPAGYWSIGMNARGASITVGGLDGTFACGLLEAVVQVITACCPVLLVVYDASQPVALDGCIHIDEPFAVALLLVSSPQQSIASLSLGVDPDSSETGLADPNLEALRRSSAPARCLPLLKAIADGQKSRVVLPYLEGLQLAIDVQSCA